ncbi:putative Cytochrome P450 2C23 [Hypsibius exemplaris]|uniref:Cytochrome P450 2C23 n=1 Tax=Hypsibius exemplaris TaxID=2072580 RepID=A0A1W0WL06_HYPEX|nr:putative Cytochrome P450 2C23 [Hypsibius exemplaris]
MTMYWSLLFMLHHPEVQAKIHAELDDKIGAGKLVRLEDRVLFQQNCLIWKLFVGKLNASQTSLRSESCEPTRRKRPNGLSHSKTMFHHAEFQVCQCRSKTLDSPVDLQSESLLDGQGKVFEPAHFMPFSIGKRACVGEALARMEIFLFFANIMQRFLIRAPRDSDIPSTDEYTTGISCRPTEFKIEIVPR